MKRVMAPGGKMPADGSDKSVVKNRGSEARGAEGQRRMRAMQSGFRAIVSEMKRVTWPSREEWVSATLVTIGLVFVVALWTSLISWIAGHIFGGAGR